MDSCNRQMATSTALREDDWFELEIEAEGGELKSIGDTVLAHWANSERNVNVQCIYQIHGFLDGPNSTAATLLVLRFDLGSRERKRRFDYFSPHFQFRKGKNAVPGDEVWVEDLYEPRDVYMSEIESKRSRKKAIQPSFNIQPPTPFDVISAGLSWTAEDSEEWVETYRYSLGAMPTSERNGINDKNDGVYWTAEVEDKNATKSAGISSFQVAMLIGRKDQSDFEVIIDIREATFSLWDDIKQLRRTITGNKGRRQIRTIKPSQKPQKPVPAQIDPNHLAKLEQDDRKVIKDLIYVGGAELLKPASRATIV